MGNDRYRATFDVVAAFPEGIAHFDVMHSLTAPMAPKHLSANLSRLVAEGLAREAGQTVNPKTGKSNTLYAPTGITFERRKVAKRPAGSKVNANLRRELSALREVAARVPELEAECIRLREFYKNACERFPELAVKPIILRGRQHLAAIFRGIGDDVRAALAESGDFDVSPAMQAAIVGLRENVADQ